MNPSKRPDIPSAAEPELRRQSAAFWEHRGSRIDRPGHTVTLMTEHSRYVDYVHRRELDFLERVIGKSQARLLDVGCGAGRVALGLAGKCRAVVGVDIAESMVQRARDEAATLGVSNAEFHHGGADSAFSQFGKFDVIVLSGVLNCVDDLEAAEAVQRCAESLTLGGTLYLRNRCAMTSRTYRPGSADSPPLIQRTSIEYEALVGAIPNLRIERVGFLFPPLCLPNSVYYHAIPKKLRDLAAVGVVLDAWFSFEALTADLRLRLLGPVYGPLMRLVGNDSAHCILQATRI